jgi:serine phosphatase RsbU (regulator of sigma subunit)
LQLVKFLTRPKKIDSVQQLFDLLQDELQQFKPKSVLYHRFIDFIVDLFNVRRASFLVYDPRLKKMRVATSRGLSKKLHNTLEISPGQGIAGYVFETARPLLVSQVSSLKRKIPKARHRKHYETSSFVSVPVIVSPFQIGEETLGVLNLTDKRDGSRFTSADLKILNLMATQAASIFRIRDLLETVQSQEGLKRELEIVHQIQERLIPKIFPKLGDLEVFGKCQLSPRGGGDYLDLVKVHDRLRGVIADVSGHHIGSAITMSAFRSIFRSLVYDPTRPGFLLKVLRWAMHEDLLKLGQFISGWVFEYHPSGYLTVSGAGHPPLLHYQAAKKKWVSIDASHLPLGLKEDARPQNKKISLEKQDLLLMYTDGLFDPRMRATGLDKQQVLEWLEGHLHLSAEKMVQQLFSEVAPHHQALSAPDDIAVLLFRRKK